ncbi:MAG: thiol-disulfide isomerase/thioredoxin [Pontimonas sp.]|jgi:thiol-disulfide isomerase/thioredoxin
MDFLTVLLFLLALIFVASLAGLWWKGNQGRVTRSVPDALSADVPLDLIDTTATLTLLQFSGPYCSYCAAMRLILGQVSAGNPHISHREIDITEYPELTKRLQVSQTPTTLLVTGAGHIHSRIRGASNATSVEHEVAHALESRKAHSDEYLI